MNDLQNKQLAIIGSSYRPEITDNLVKHCITTLKAKGLRGEQITTVSVPGALEIPLTAKQLAKRKIYNAIIVFGSVLKGSTYHFEQVSDECVRGCMQVAYDFEIPVIFEVLSVYDMQDALERANGSEDNRGVEGALTALTMIKLASNL